MVGFGDSSIPGYVDSEEVRLAARRAFQSISTIDLTSLLAGTILTFATSILTLLPILEE
jgi:hypothetical protein